MNRIFYKNQSTRNDYIFIANRNEFLYKELTSLFQK